MNDESLFAFASIWDEWRGNEISITSCAIITTIANNLLASHSRRMLFCWTKNLRTLG